MTRMYDPERDDPFGDGDDSDTFDDVRHDDEDGDSSAFTEADEDEDDDPTTDV